jgi:hypothetical protein
MFATTAIPSLLFLVTTFLVPESPRWLAEKGRERQALDLLERQGSTAYAAKVLKDFKAVSDASPQLSLLHELAAPGVVKVLILFVLLAVPQK